MKILWVKSDYLHPTTKGGQIRTLEMLRRVHAKHEVHYVAFVTDEAGPAQASEYCTRHYPIPLRIPSKTSPLFLLQLLRGLFSKVPVAVDRYRSAEMRRVIDQLQSREKFDLLICDFLVPSINISKVESFVLFQHNVETVIWRRHTEQADHAAKRWYMARQARLMEAYEREVCVRSKHVVAVSESDAGLFREMYGVESQAVATGVDVKYFRCPEPPLEPEWDLIFLGSMDWLPNIHGVEQFFEKVLPRIRTARPSCSMAIVGRHPSSSLRARAERLGVHVTGTVPDVRPYLWKSKVSVVPLYIGGGTRLKIYECMAAGVPVVSTSIGAEGLAVESGTNIEIADTPEEFAEQCLRLLSNEDERKRIAMNGLRLVEDKFSWERVTDEFLDGIVTACAPRSQGT